MTTRAKEIRVKAKLSQTAAAALAGCSPNTWRLFESAPEAITPEKRAACDAALARLEATAGVAAGAVA